MANRSVTVRYILDASGYRSGANDIAAADQRIAAAARASAANMDQQQAKVARGQQKATQAFVAGGKAQAEAVTKVGRASAASTRIIEDAERRKVRIQEDTTRRVERVQADSARRISKTNSDAAKEQIRQSATLRAARIREDAATRAARIGEDAGVRASRADEGGTTSLQQRAAAYTQVGRSALVAGGLIGAGLGLSARAAIQWQSDFTGVTKTVNGSNEQLAGLETQLRGLSREMPQSSTAIAGIAENAGQLGIQTGSIAAFTKTMVQLGDTTNLSSDEAATSLAQLGNIMGTINGPADQVNDTISRTGATIVGLGNSGASTEQQITQLGLRIAGAGRAIGLNTQEVLGFSSAIASTGVEAEAGGTGFSNFAFKVDAAVREGGPKLDLLAKTAGTSSAEFQKAYGEDSAKAITSFIEGLGRAQAAGQDTNGTLKGLGVTGIREADVIRRLALSGDLLSRSLSTANQSFNDNSALTNEATKRYETDAARIQIAVNKIKDDAIDIGGAVLPVISGVTDQVSKYADAFKGLSPQAQSGIVKGGAISAGILLVGGAALSAVGSVASLASNLQQLGATGPKIAGAAKSIGTYGAVLAAGYGALQGAVAIQEHFIGRSQIASVDDATTALQGLAKTGDSAGLNTLFKYVGQGNKSLSSNGLVKLTTDVNGVSDAFKVLNDPTAFDSIRSGLDGFLGVIGINAGKGGLKTAAADIAAVDQSLKGLVTNGQGADAAKAFAQLTPQALAAGDSVTTLAQKFPEYAKAVNLATETNGYHIASDQELVDIMGGKIPPALKAAASANKNLAGAVGAVTGANLGQSQTFGQQLTAIQKTTSGLLGLRSAHNDVEAAIDNAEVSIKQNGKTLDVSTAKGRANRQALDNIAVGAQNYTTVLGKQGKSALQIVEANEKSRQSYIKLAQAAGQSKGAATANANDLFKLPKNVTTQVAVKVSGASSKQVHDLNTDIQKLPKEQRAKIVTIAEDKGLKAAKNAIKDITDKPKTARVKTEVEKPKKQADPKPLKQKILQQFSTESAPKPKTLTQKIKQVVSGPSDTGGALDSKKSRTINFNSKVTPPKAPKAPKGATIAYKSKVESPKAPKPPKGATITYKVKVDKTAKVPVPKGGTVRIKTAVDLSGVSRAKAGVASVKGRSVKIKTSADLSGANAARSAINSLPGSKTITITTVKREVTKKAGGGKVTGPGTNTSDSIDARLSDEEWVIRASSSKRYGDGIMAAINAGSIPRSALEPYSYASGGKAGYPAMGFAKGGKVTLADIIRAANQAVDPLADVRQAEKDLAKIHKKSGQEYKDAVKALKDATKAAGEAIREFGKTLSDQYTTSSTNAGDQLLSQQQGLADLKALQARVDQLQKLGLSNEQIAAIVKRASDGDVQGATALAGSIVEGGKPLVNQLNEATKSLSQIATLLAADTQTKKVKAYATGGQISGPGSATSDTAGLFALSNREWVHPTAAVDYYGEAFMHAVQTRTLPRQRVSGYLAQGGGVGVKVVTAPSNIADFVRALEGVTVMVQNPWGPGYMAAQVAGVADQRIGAAFTDAGSAR